MEHAVRPCTLADLQALVGRVLGPGEWHEISQEVINRFADATGDHQWIHVDPARAAKGPFGSTIAHGVYSLSLAPGLSNALMDHSGFAHSLNYGYDRIRFPSPVPVGSRIRMTMTVTSVEEVRGGVQVRSTQTIELQGSTKPIVVAEAVGRVVLAEDGS